MSIRLKLTLLLFMLFSISVGNTVFIFLLEDYGEQKLDWVIHTHTVLHQTEKLLASMTDTETGQRGYLLTTDPIYLEPYLSGLALANESYNQLVSLTKDNKNQQKRLLVIQALMNKKFEELKFTIDLQKSAEPESIKKAMEIVKKNTGKQYMDDIRLEIISFENEEKILLETRKGDFRENRAQITTVIAIEIAFFILMGTITAFFIQNKLFSPIEMLLTATSKMEKGQKQTIEDILPNDEMGYLLSRFYKMS
ncbi:MAG: CHASE3 domain-containing protein, partial [Alcanivoracaceae bacterium]|nr:CHASE3 domain-containing protein [Alcanivoracaceae bacterium]